jgi:hypothetical protein
MNTFILIISIIFAMQGCSENSSDIEVLNFSKKLSVDLEAGRVSINDYFDGWEKIIILKPYDNSTQLLRKYGVDNYSALDFADIEVRDDITVIAVVIGRTVVAAAELKRNICDLSEGKLVFERTDKPLVILRDSHTSKCRFG